MVLCVFILAILWLELGSMCLSKKLLVDKIFDIFVLFSVSYIYVRYLQVLGTKKNLQLTNQSYPFWIDDLVDLRGYGLTQKANICH